MYNKILVIDDNVEYIEKLTNKLETSLNTSCKVLQDCDNFEDIKEFDLYFVRIHQKNEEIIDTLTDNNKLVVLLTNDDNDYTKNIIQNSGASDYIITSVASKGDVALRIANRLINNSKVTVMIVDDSPSILFKLSIILETQNLNYVKCSNAQEAWDYLNNPVATSIDIIITDYEMPVMDGYEFTKLVRTKFPMEELPILVLSGTQDTLMIAKFLKIGANDYIPKPYINEEFIARLSNTLNILEMFKKIRNMAMTDHLTGLYNRAYFYQAGEQLLFVSRRSSIPIALCMIDIDNFKSVNDTYGHDIGDRALKHVSNTIKKSIRASDIVARFGGEEFVILLSNCSKFEAYQVVSNIVKTVSDSILDLDNETQLHITISAGLSETVHSLDSMIKEADESMYKAKHNGKNQVFMQVSKPAN